MWPLPMMHWISPYRDPTAPPSPQMWDLIVQESTSPSALLPNMEPPPSPPDMFELVHYEARKVG